jgi:hypothetical protein
MFVPVLGTRGGGAEILLLVLVVVVPFVFCDFATIDDETMSDFSEPFE